MYLVNWKTNSEQTPTTKTTAEWNVQASRGSLNTTNPIREIIETINLAENPAKKVIPLSIGDPTIFGNLKPCQEILDSLRCAETSGRFYGYQTAAGLENARQAVANYHNKNTGNLIEAKDVILASGCSHAIDLCISVLAERGQNILIPRPGFPLYKTLTSVYGINYKQYNLLANSNWMIDLKHLESLIDDRTAAIVINNPSNPCGSVFDEKHLREILELAERYKKPIIADEIYDKFVFAPEHYKLLDIVFNNINNNINNSKITAFNSKQQQIASSNNGVYGSINEQHQSSQLILKQQQLSNNSLMNKTLINGNSHNHNDEGKLIKKETLNHQEEMNDNHDISRVSEHHIDIDENFEPQLTIPLQNKHLRIHYKNPCKITSRTITSDLDITISQTNTNYITLSQQENNISCTYAPFIALSSLTRSVPILTCGGISKTCRIPGLRLGWIIINDPVGAFENSVRHGLNRLTQRLMGPNSLAQGALKDILEKVPESFYTNTMEFIFQNAILCYQRITQMPGLKPHMPQGSMYLMVGFEASSFPLIDGDLDFTSKLMNEESVLVLPGKCFEYPNYFRICLTVPTNIMEEALDRMESFCVRYHLPTTTTNLDPLTLSKKLQLSHQQIINNTPFNYNDNK